MGKRRRILAVCGGLALSLSCGLIVSNSLQKPAVSVSAGSSKRYAFNSSTVVDGRINTGDLRVTGAVSGVDSSLLFAEGKAIAKMRINNYKAAQIEKLYQADFRVELASLSDGGAFRACSGLPSVSSTSTDKGVLSFNIEKKVGSVFFSVYESYGEGMNTEILAPKEIAGLDEGEKADFSITVLTSGKVTVSINGSKVVDNASLLESGTGYFGFFSEGKNNVKLSNAVVYGYTYNAPENVPSYTETFDKELGSYNANYFYTEADSSPVTPSYLGVDKDVGALHFSNVSNAHISTKYMYSNFLMEFDIPQMRKTATYDENGSVISPITTGFGVGWGIEDPMSTAGQTWSNSTWIHFENIRIDGNVDHTVENAAPMVRLYSARSAYSSVPLSKNFFSTKEKRVPYIKVSLVNGDLNVYVRYEGEASYGDPIFHYDLGETAEGYLRILTLGDSSVPSKGISYASISNFSIDDLHIENLDAPSYRQETSVDYRSNGVSGASDFDYTTKTDDSDLVGNKLKSGDAKAKGNAAGLITAFSVPSFLALGTLLVTFLKRR